ncbi:Uncharacterized protein Adt_02584 [Abeliophyllum distichum]|uniref:Uncharacterized protein n=1 Tax=Abeliophyllum distichum TaxID=126358 RepID=A0ABD1VW23_9LAMI
MSHRDDDAGDPPQEPPHRLELFCESGWGISQGINLENVWQANGKMPLPIAFDNVECIMQPIKNNVKYFMCLVGNQVRFTVPPCYPSWTEVPEEQRARLRSIIKSDEYRTVCAAVDRLAADCYQDYKLKAHNHLKAHGPSCPYDKMSSEDWQKCIDFLTSPTFVERSTKNKVNRDKTKYSSMQGSKSFSVTRYDEDKLVELRDTQQIGVASSSASLDERAIAKEVLGERRGHVRRVGRISKGTSPSLDSTTTSKTPQETFHQFSGDPQHDNPRFAMYEAQLRRMLQKIELVKNSIPRVVPEKDENENENEDEDEGLGGFVDF